MPEFAEALRSVAAGEPRRTIEIGNNDVSYLLQVVPYQDPDGRRRGAIVTLTDITELVALRRTAAEAFSKLEAASAALTQQATYDTVTEKLNRAAFTQGVDRELARAARAGTEVALVWIDLDRFKGINDHFGHEAGDMVLRTCADRIASAVRQTDLVGRIGGDEFGVLLTNGPTEGELDVILERLVAVLAEPIAIRDAEVSVGASLGIALYPRDESTADGLLRAADAAMYEVKRNGGNDFAYFSVKMNEAAELRHTMRRLVEQGMTNGEFEVFYQPIVHTNGGQVWGVESLIRWRRNKEIVPAAEFITFCQESGQIRALGLLTLGLLRSDIAALRDAGHSALHVSVNFSAEQLADPHLASLLAQWSATDGLERVVIEIVESVFLPSNADGLATVQELSALGAGISIDDYGSGYSNIRLVKELSPDFVKLDRTFLGPDSEMERVTVLDVDRALIRSAIEMAHAIGAEVVAEGIEDAATMQAVTDLGADYIQGYHIARPMPLADLLLWLDGRTTAG
jgi:two-component system CheB/CheR fusion protein